VSFKSILASLAPIEVKQAGGEFAISMAEALKAHVTACTYALDPSTPGSGLPWFPDDLVESHMANVVKAAQVTIQNFKDAAKSRKVETACEVLRTSLATATDAFGEYARIYDVAVLTQTSRGLEHSGDLFTEAALFYSGRPVILVPRDYSAGFRTDRVLIAWDGSQHAARAVSHAMPLLQMAQKIEVLAVGDKEKIQKSRAAGIVKNLERHGYDVDLICQDERDDAGAIAREAAARRASLLIMGGYGHSRAREIIFGGVTRYMASQAPVPVLMAH
jgi:nucleotide-binding universal stress UspA family protein